jgi:hypothetical protein
MRQGGLGDIQLFEQGAGAFLPGFELVEDGHAVFVAEGFEYTSAFLV